MSFSAKVPETPQTILDGQEQLGARLLLTIPYGSSVEKMQGFVSVIGGSGSDDNLLPVLTVCVQNPNAASLVSVLSTIVFKNDSHYLDFVDKLMTDAYLHFKQDIISN